MKHYTWQILVIAVVLISGTVFLTTNKPSRETIKLGGVFALTGDAAAWGEAAQNGARMAVEEINARGGVNGKKLELISEDTRSSSKDTISAVQKLQSFESVNALLVSWLDVYQGAESVLKPGTILIAPDAGVEAVNGTTNHPGVFSTWYRSGPKAELAVKFMSERGAKSLYILTENDSYYETFGQFLHNAAQKYDVRVIGHEKLNADTDVRTTLAKIRSAQPDAVFFAFYDQSKNTEFLNLYRNSFADNTIVFGDEITFQNYLSGDYPKELFNNIYFFAPRKPDEIFFANYTTRFGTEPVFGAGPTYDAVYILAKMFEDAPANPDEYLHSHTFNTASFGQITFDKIGGVQTTQNYFSIQQIQNGELVEIIKAE